MRLFPPVSVCPLGYSKNYEWILMKIFEGVGCGPRNNQLDFYGDPHHNLDPGIF